jgi:hypothetical protein
LGLSLLLAHPLSPLPSHPPPLSPPPVLRAHLSELDEAIDEMIDETVDAFADLLFWRGRAAAASLALCISWQALLTYPDYIPSTVPLVCVFYLARTYLHAVRVPEPPIAGRPSPRHLLMGLLLGRAPSPISAAPLTAAQAQRMYSAAKESADDSDSDSDSDEDRGGGGILNLKLLSRFKPPPGSLQAALKDIKDEIDDEVPPPCNPPVS